MDDGKVYYMNKWLDAKDAVAARDAEIAALKARLAGTVYDGTEATLPAEGTDVVVFDGCLVEAVQRKSAKWIEYDGSLWAHVNKGDRWWPLQGGE